MTFLFLFVGPQQQQQQLNQGRMSSQLQQQQQHQQYQGQLPPTSLSSGSGGNHTDSAGLKLGGQFNPHTGGGRAGGRTDLLFAADSVTSAMSSLVNELNSGMTVTFSPHFKYLHLALLPHTIKSQCSIMRNSLHYSANFYLQAFRCRFNGDFLLHKVVSLSLKLFFNRISNNISGKRIAQATSRFILNIHYNFKLKKTDVLIICVLFILL